jgi:hypothetical protein
MGHLLILPVTPVNHASDLNYAMIALTSETIRSWCIHVQTTAKHRVWNTRLSYEAMHDPTPRFVSRATLTTAFPRLPARWERTRHLILRSAMDITQLKAARLAYCSLHAYADRIRWEACGKHEDRPVETSPLTLKDLTRLSRIRIHPTMRRLNRSR